MDTLVVTILYKLARDAKARACNIPPSHDLWRPRNATPVGQFKRPVYADRSGMLEIDGLSNVQPKRKLRQLMAESFTASAPERPDPIPKSCIDGLAVSLRLQFKRRQPLEKTLHFALGNSELPLLSQAIPLPTSVDFFLRHVSGPPDLVGCDDVVRSALEAPIAYRGVQRHAPIKS